MPSLKETKRRIASVNSTLKITSAMKMVASAKLHQAQNAIGNMVPYEYRLQSILSSLMVADPSVCAGVPFLSTAERETECKKVAIVAFSSNSSLCGAFNANAIRSFFRTLEQYPEADVYVVGKKISDAVRRAGIKAAEDLSELSGKPSYEAAASLSEALLNRYLNGEIAKVVLVYNHFASTASQPTIVEDYLPFSIPNDPAAESLDYIVEPDPATLAKVLLDKVLKLKIYTVFLDTNAAEHAARTVAMQMASDNAEKLLQELTLEYNKRRQQAITSEILDIVSGSMA